MPPASDFVRVRGRVVRHHRDLSLGVSFDDLSPDAEDTIQDLIGYLVLLKVATERKGGQ